jgi:hypothetical protein
MFDGGLMFNDSRAAMLILKKNTLEIKVQFATPDFSRRDRVFLTEIYGWHQEEKNECISATKQICIEFQDRLKESGQLRPDVVLAVLLRLATMLDAVDSFSFTITDSQPVKANIHSAQQTPLDFTVNIYKVQKELLKEIRLYMGDEQNIISEKHKVLFAKLSIAMLFQPFKYLKSINIRNINKFSRTPIGEIVTEAEALYAQVESLEAQDNRPLDSIGEQFCELLNQLKEVLEDPFVSSSKNWCCCLFPSSNNESNAELIPQIDEIISFYNSSIKGRALPATPEQIKELFMQEASDIPEVIADEITSFTCNQP